MGVLEGEGQRLGAAGEHDQVDVVRHEAITDDRKGVDAAVGAEEVEVDEAVGIGFEDGLARVAALGDVIGRISREDACETGHTWK